MTDSTTLNLYSWHEEHYYNLCQQLLWRNRIPNALLLYANSNLGLHNLALMFIKRILCSGHTNNTQGKLLLPCNDCENCRLFESNTHPDLIYLQPPTPSSLPMSIANDNHDKNTSKANTSDEGESGAKDVAATITKIADIRLAINYANLSVQNATYKVVYVQDINKLNVAASNALLKILEEPNKKVIFVLVSLQLSNVLPTIISRCYKYRVRSANTHAANLYGNDFWAQYFAPSLLFVPPFNNEVRELFINTLAKPTVSAIFKLVDALKQESVTFAVVVEFISKWISDVASYCYTQHLNYFCHYAAIIDAISVQIANNKLFFLQDKITDYAKWLHHPLNYKLHLENLLFCYQQLFTPT